MEELLLKLTLHSLQEEHNGNSVYIDPSEVIVVQGYGGYTDLTFQGGIKLYVQETPDELAEKIKDQAEKNRAQYEEIIGDIEGDEIY